MRLVRIIVGMGIGAFAGLFVAVIVNGANGSLEPQTIQALMIVAIAIGPTLGFIAAAVCNCYFK